MDPIVILGIGNRLMMDDGIGVYMVEELKNECQDLYARFMIGETDIDYCLDIIEGCKFMIIIDAVQNGQKPGDISVFPLKELPIMRLGYSAHDLHFFHMLQTIEVEGFVFGIEPYHIKFQDHLSEEMSRRYPLIKEKLRKEIFILRDKMGI